MKPNVYVETSVLSYLTARPSNDLRAMANQSVTVEWWETRASHYNAVVSDLVISEAGRGNPDAAERRLAALADLPLLEISDRARVLAMAPIDSHALPQKAEADAYHVAIGYCRGERSRVFADMELYAHCQCPYSTKDRGYLQGARLRTPDDLHPA